MKRIVLAITAFVAGYFVLDRALYAAVTPAFQRTDFIHAQVLARQPDVLFLGDSQCRHGIVPSAATEPLGMDGYNMARAGSGIVYSSGIYRVVASRYQPRMLVIQVMRLTGDRGAASSLAPYLDEPGVRDLMEHYPPTVRLKYSLSRMLRFNSQLITMAYRLFQGYDAMNGYVPLYGVAAADRTRIDVGGSIALDGVEALGTSLLASLVASAREAGSQVWFIEMPTLNALQVDPRGVYRTVAADQNIPYLNFNVGGEYDVRFPPEYFRDVDHLNDDGAQAFSAALGRAIATRFGANAPIDPNRSSRSGQDIQ